MDSMTRTIERREYERFYTHKDAFACLGGGSAMLGQIVNISTSGLLFHYPGSTERTSDKSLLHILMIDGSFSSGWLPIRIVWDSKTPPKCFFDEVPVRFCGVLFGNMTEDQRSDLEYFIKNYATVPTKP